MSEPDAEEAGFRFDRYERATWNRRDYQMLDDGGVILYRRPEPLTKDMHALDDLGYHVYSLDLRGADSESSIHSLLADRLDLPDYYGMNLNALEDVMRDLCERAPYAAVILEGFTAVDRIDAAFGRALLNVFARASRDWLLYGQRLIIMVQSDDG